MDRARGTGSRYHVAVRLPVVVCGLALVALTSACLPGQGGGASATPTSTIAAQTSRPSSSAPAVAAATATAIAPPPPATPAGNVYTVKEGDTLSGIASSNNSTVDQIVKANNITDPNKISIGQKLVIPPTDVAPSAAASSPPGAAAKPGASPPASAGASAAAPAATRPPPP